MLFPCIIQGQRLTSVPACVWGIVYPHKSISCQASHWTGPDEILLQTWRTPLPQAGGGALLCFCHIWDVRNGEICYFWDTLWEDSDRQERLCLDDLHMKMFQQKRHALICCRVIRLPKCVTYSCFISIVHVGKNHSGKLWRFANLTEIDRFHKNKKNMSESQLQDQKRDFV